jgi:uncharacterized protein (DUF1330 family)
MPKGYWIVRADVHDLDRYKTYLAANAECFRKYGARILVRGGSFETVEGTSRSRHGVIEFASYAIALDCWRSADYQAALDLRHAISDVDIVVAEGVTE